MCLANWFLNQNHLFTISFFKHDIMYNFKTSSFLFFFPVDDNTWFIRWHEIFFLIDLPCRVTQPGSGSNWDVKIAWFCLILKEPTEKERLQVDSDRVRKQRKEITNLLNLFFKENVYNKLKYTHYRAGNKQLDSYCDYFFAKLKQFY